MRRISFSENRWTSSSIPKQMGCYHHPQLPLGGWVTYKMRACKFGRVLRLNVKDRKKLNHFCGPIFVVPVPKQSKTTTKFACTHLICNHVSNIPGGNWWMVYRLGVLKYQQWVQYQHGMGTLKKANFECRWYFTSVQRTDNLSIRFKVKNVLQLYKTRQLPMGAGHCPWGVAVTADRNSAVFLHFLVMHMDPPYQI